LKFLGVLKAILQRMEDVDVDALIATEFKKSTLLRVEPLEDGDSEEIMFKRRMGLRYYFKDLFMNVERIEKTKKSRAASGKSEATPLKKK